MVNPTNSSHYSYLLKSYDEVGKKTWLEDDFLDSQLLNSQNLFTKESLVLGKPKPKELEVYALLSGVSFDKEVTNKLVSIQQKISKVLDNSLHYWVKPLNLGVEYCVFKWPEENWNKAWYSLIDKEVSALSVLPFKFVIKGIQVNPDGCIIAKGYDENRSLFRIREQFKNNLKFLPSRQSNWAHIPMGRILEPIGVSKFKKLESLVNILSSEFIVEFEINIVKFIHEKRWYMEEKSILMEHYLK